MEIVASAVGRGWLRTKCLVVLKQCWACLDQAGYMVIAWTPEFGIAFGLGEFRLPDPNTGKFEDRKSTRLNSSHWE